jgi:hypothetical protein
MDLGPVWAGVQLVTVGRFDNNTTNIQFLVQNTVDHHLYEWWIANNNTLTGIDLGAYWSNVQLIGNSHYNNNSAFNELLVRNTTDGHFYEWWIANNQLSGGDLGAVPTSATVADSSSATVAGSIITAVTSGSGAMAGTSALAGSAATSGGGEVATAGLSSTIGTDASLPATSPDSTPLLVQSMASFGSSGAVANSTGALAGIDPSQQSALAATIEQQPNRV